MSSVTCRCGLARVTESTSPPSLFCLSSFFSPLLAAAPPLGASEAAADADADTAPAATLFRSRRQSYPEKLGLRRILQGDGREQFFPARFDLEQSFIRLSQFFERFVRASVGIRKEASLTAPSFRMLLMK